MDKDTYFDTYREACQFALNSAKLKGFEITEEEESYQFMKYSSMRPKEGNSVDITFELEKNGKVSKKALHIQVYAMSTKYELTHYIN